MKRFYFSLMLLCCIGLLIQICRPERSFASAFFYITNNGDNTVSTIKVRDNSYQGTVNTGSGPFGITADDLNAYITNSLDDTVSAISLSYGTIAYTFNTGAAPKGITFNTDNSYLYVADSNDDNVSMINVEENSHETISVGASPLGVAISPNNDFVYVTNNGDDSLSVISTDENELFVTLRDHYYIFYSDSDDVFFNKPSGVAVGLEGLSIYVVNSGSNSLTILYSSTIYAQGDDFDWDDYDAEDDEDGPYSATSIDVGNDPRCVALNPDESYAYVTNYGDDTVSVIDVYDNAVSDIISVGDGPYGIAITPSGEYLYVVNYLDGTVSVIYTDYAGKGEYDENEVIATLDVGSSPIGFGNFIVGTTPKAPSSLVVSLIGNSGAKLTWTDNSEDEIGFRVLRKRFSSGKYNEIATLDENTTEYSDSGLEQSSNYYYKVCTYNHMGNSDYAEEEFVTTSLESSCFIATAAYGSFTEPHVQLLRDFRNRFLLTSKAGIAFVNFYYKYSPPIADFIARHELMRDITRLCLLPLIGISWIMLSTGPAGIIILPILIILLLIMFIRLRQNTLRLAAGMNGEANHGEAR